MNWQDHIEQKPGVMCGKPVIKGTRITVELLLERLGDGWPAEDVLASIPGLEPKHIQAAQAFAAAYLAGEESVFLETAPQ